MRSGKMLFGNLNTAGFLGISFLLNCHAINDAHGAVDDGSQSAWVADLATIANRQAHHGYPRLANDTQVSWGGNESNGYLGRKLFDRLHWFDFIIVDGNNSATRRFASLTPYLGYRGSIRALNPNSVQVAYFSIGDFSDHVPETCHHPLAAYFAFGPNFDETTCTHAGGDTFNKAWLYHDVSGQPLKLYNFGTYFSYIPDPAHSGFRQRFIDAVERMIIANHNTDGLFHDWGGCTEIPYLGGYHSVSLANDGIDNLGGVANVRNIHNAVNRDWQEGLVSLYAEERSAYPVNFLLTGNSGYGDQELITSFTKALQGAQLENFINAVKSVGWGAPMHTYATWVNDGRRPNFALIQADISFTPPKADADNLLYDLIVSSGHQWITEMQMQELRFGLTSALMFDGYFAMSVTGGVSRGYSAALWLDEFAVNARGAAVAPADATAADARAAKGWLGLPLGPAYNVSHSSKYKHQTLWSVLQIGLSNAAGASVWRRDFASGIVLVNPTASPQTIDLGGTYRKIKGIVDPIFNDGAAAVTSVTLPSQSGIVLLRTDRRLT